jgi:hypothetical protein
MTKLHEPLAWVSRQLLAWLVNLGFVHSHSGIAAVVVLFAVFVLTGAILGGIIGMARGMWKNYALSK